MTPTSVCKRNPLAAAIIAATVSTFSINAVAQLEEVIVTAQKRAESAQDVPIAITAFDASALEQKQITGFADMRFAAPAVSYTKANFSGNNFKIRGIGSDLTAASSDAGVGIHVNEVPVLAPRLFETEYYDVQQLSVLRGPQGTLYGRNSTGGALNMETAKASTDEMFGNVEGQYGDYDHTKVVGHVNIPVTDSLAVRFAGIYLERDGYTDNQFTGNDVDGRDQYSVRGSVRWLPTENTTIDLMVSYFDEDSNRSRSQKTQCDYDPIGALGCLPDSLGFSQPNAAAVLGGQIPSTQVSGPLGAYDLFSQPQVDTPRDLRTVASRLDPVYNAEETLVTLSMAHEFDNYTVSFVGGYQDTDVFSRVDYTWNVPAPLPVNPLIAAILPQNAAAFINDDGFAISSSSGSATGVVGGNVFGNFAGLEAYDESRASNDQTSAEIRLQSDYDGPFNFLIGGFYMDASNDGDYWVFSSGLDYFGLVTVPSSLGINPETGIGNGDGLGLVSPAFNSETKDYQLDSTAFFGEVYYEFTDTLKLTLGMRYTDDEKKVTSRSPLFTGGFQPVGADLPNATPYDNFEDDWQETTGRVVLDWAMNDDMLLYGSYSRGYKGGGFNPPFNAAEFPNQSTTFEPEFVDAFEVGFKSQLLDNTLQANLSAFFYDYSDLQVSKIINRTSFNENTDAEMYGAEAEFVWAPTNGLTLNANFSYLHTEVKDFASIDSREPSGGLDPDYNPGKDIPLEDQKTVLKSLSFAAACVADVAPSVWETLGLGIGPGARFTNCDDVVAAGLATGGVEEDLEGNQLTNSPEWSMSLGAQYAFDFANASELVLRVDYYWQDEMYTRLYNRGVDKVDDWDVWNGQATYTSSDASWYARGFVKNIADEDHTVGHYFTDASSGNFTNIFLIEPRTYGLALGYNF